MLENRLHIIGCEGEEEPEIIGHCSICGEDIYSGTDYYDIDGDIICTDCLEDWAKPFLVEGD